MIVCGAHFEQKDYVPGDVIEFRNQVQVRLVASTQAAAGSSTAVAPPPTQLQVADVNKDLLEIHLDRKLS